MPHWTTVLQRLAVQSASAPPVAPKDRRDISALRAYSQALGEHAAKQQHYYFGLKSNGSFVVEDVLPGAYGLQIRVTEPPKDPLDSEAAVHSFSPEFIGSVMSDIVVPEAPADQPEQPFDSGVFTLQFKGDQKSSE